MRYLFFLVMAGVTFQAQGFELMKCTGRTHGTIWASFGHLMRSDRDGVRTFPTEIVLFAPDVSARRVFTTLEESLQVDVADRGSSVRMAFSVPKGSGEQHHLLQLLRYDPRMPNAAVGNWKVTEDGQPERHDFVACSLD